MTWFYEIRDSNHVVASTGKGFETDKAAMAAGRKKARELKASGSLPGGEIAILDRQRWKRRDRAVQGSAVEGRQLAQDPQDEQENPTPEAGAEETTAPETPAAAEEAPEAAPVAEAG